MSVNCWDCISSVKMKQPRKPCRNEGSRYHNQGVQNPGRDRCSMTRVTNNEDRLIDRVQGEIFRFCNERKGYIHGAFNVTFPKINGDLMSRTKKSDRSS